MSGPVHTLWLNKEKKFCINPCKPLYCIYLYIFAAISNCLFFPCRLKVNQMMELKNCAFIIVLFNTMQKAMPEYYIWEQTIADYMLDCMGYSRRNFTVKSVLPFEFIDSTEILGETLRYGTQQEASRLEFKFRSFICEPGNFFSSGWVWPLSLYDTPHRIRFHQVCKLHSLEFRAKSPDSSWNNLAESYVFIAYITSYK